ncbi:MAG: hypothetical protein R2695_08535, partial [Acidimicrobiales bacterium]
MSELPWPNVPPDPDFERRLEKALLAELTVSTGSETPTHVLPNDSIDPFGPEQENHMHLSDVTRRGRMIAAAAIVVIVAGLGLLAVSRPGPTEVEPAAGDSVPVEFTVEWPALGGLESTKCVDTSVTYEWAVQGRCFRTFVGESSFTGDVTGTALWSMDANLGVGGDGDATVEIPAGF